jgi:hypothetical protein
MTRRNSGQAGDRKICCGLLFVAMLLTAVRPALSTKDREIETIEATATGTSTQLGRIVNVKVIIYEYSTEEDAKILVDAFEKGRNQGLVNALTRMRSVGRIAITGTVGYDLSFIRAIPTPTGRKIRFATNRPIRFGEAFFDTQSVAYNVTAGELDLNDSDRKKSSGVLFPAAELTLNKEKQLEFKLNRNPWKLVDIIDRNKGIR